MAGQRGRDVLIVTSVGETPEEFLVVAGIRAKTVTKLAYGGAHDEEAMFATRLSSTGQLVIDADGGPWWRMSRMMRRAADDARVVFLTGAQRRLESAGWERGA